MSSNLRPKVGVGIVVIKDDLILFGRRKGAHGAGDWSFPGGHLEYGETVEECAIRELSEETGLKALKILLGPWVNDVIEDKHYVTLVVFVTEFEGELQLLEPNKCDGWHWFKYNNFPSPLFPPITSLIKKISPEQLITIEHNVLQII